MMDIEEFFCSWRIVSWRMEEVREQLKADEENLRDLIQKNYSFEDKGEWDKLEEALTWVKSDRKKLIRMAKENGDQIFSLKETDLLIMKAEELICKRTNFLISNGRG